MKFTALTDLHIHNYKRFDKSGSRLNNCLDVIQDVFSYNDENDIEYTLFSGDLFDSEKTLPTIVVNNTIKVLKNMFDQHPKQKWICISGNHDYATKNLIGTKAETALSHLALIFPGRFILIDNHFHNEKYEIMVTGIPYFEYKEHFIEKLQEVSEKCSEEYHETYSDEDPTIMIPNILMIHQTPKNSNPMIPFDIEATDPLFDNYDLIICGHIHKREKLSPKFWLVGSPIHKSLEDEGEEKGFMVFDTEDLLNPEFIYLEDYPHFRRSSNPDDLDGDSGDFIIPIVEVEEEDNDHNVENFSTSLKNTDLVKNYWDEVDGDDEELLKLGLSFLN